MDITFHWRWWGNQESSTCYLTWCQYFIVAFVTFVFFDSCCFFSSAFLGPCALIAPKKNATFLTRVKGYKNRSYAKRTSMSEKQHSTLKRRFLPQMALSQASLLLQTSFQAFCSRPSSILHTHCAFTILHFPTIIALTKHNAALFMALLFNWRQVYFVLFMLGMISFQNRLRDIRNEEI